VHNVLQFFPSFHLPITLGFTVQVKSAFSPNSTSRLIASGWLDANRTEYVSASMLKRF
jgi:hypothetical protein